MTVFFDTRETDRIPQEHVSVGPSSGFFENLQASFNETIALDVDFTGGMMRNEARKERRSSIERATGKPFREAIKPFMPPARGGITFQAREEIAIDTLRDSLPREEQGVILNDAQLEERGREIALERHARNKDVQARNRSFGASAGQFVGAGGASLADPFVIATLPFGAAAGARTLTAVAIESAIAAGSVAAAQPFVQARRAELGVPAGFAEAVQNITTAAVFAGGFTGILRGAGALLGRASNRQLVREFDKTIKDPTPEQKATRDALERDTEIAEASPFDDTPEADAEHVTRATTVERAMQQGEQPPDLPEPPPGLAPEPRPAVGPAAPQAAPGGAIYQFDPDTIATDAARFQFKADGDDLGVTDRLRGVEQWDPMRAGVVVVWEDAGGRRFIADGHQRLGLAQRIKSADPAQRPLLQGFLLREADGITDVDARYLAAAKNIAEGTGTAIDAAKVLRARREIGAGLPPNSAVVRDAKGLSNLSDDAFGMVVNRVVNESHAAIVGRLAPDQPDVHAQVLQTLADVKPSNMVEAESIVRDVLSAPRVREVQDDLFGSGETTQILFKERAKVLSAAASRLKKDRAAFNVLVREEARLTEAGNVLDTAGNLERASDDAKILTTLQKLARRKGPIADALARAAADLKAGKRSGDVVKRFIDDVRRAADGTDGDGGPDGGGGRSGQGGDDGGAPPTATPRDDGDVSAGARDLDDGTPQSDLPLASPQRAAAPELVEGFADPAGDAIAAQADALEAELRLELDGAQDFDVPIGAIEGADGELTVQTVKASELLDDARADAEFADQLGLCLK